MLRDCGYKHIYTQACGHTHHQRCWTTGYFFESNDNFHLVNTVAISQCMRFVVQRSSTLDYPTTCKYFPHVLPCIHLTIAQCYTGLLVRAIRSIYKRLTLSKKETAVGLCIHWNNAQPASSQCWLCIMRISEFISRIFGGKKNFYGVEFGIDKWRGVQAGVGVIWVTPWKGMKSLWKL